MEMQSRRWGQQGLQDLWSMVVDLFSWRLDCRYWVLLLLPDMLFISFPAAMKDPITFWSNLVAVLVPVSFTPDS